MIIVLIKRILIITNDGIPVFDYEEYARGDEALVGGLITALTKFAEETEKETISRVMLQESQFILKKYNSILFVFQVLDEMPGEYAEQILNLIAINFLKRHGEDIKNFVGNVSSFRSFQSVCKEILQKTGVHIANLLIQRKKTEDPLAWGIFSIKGQALLVKTDAPNYNIDSFAIMQVLGKSLRKIFYSQFQQNSGIAFHFSSMGHMIQTIVLPYVQISLERKLENFSAQDIRKFRIMTQQQIEKLVSDKLSQVTPYTCTILRKFKQTENDSISSIHLNLLDLFQASIKGFDYLFNAETIIQCLTFENTASLLLNLPNRYVFLDFNEKIESQQILKQAIEIITSVSS
ncbi:MAG: hypothetical protein ACTSPI_06785 [Candidatus Heimdallarchaeaceae archaeon]